MILYNSSSFQPVFLIAFTVRVMHSYQLSHLPPPLLSLMLGQQLYFDASLFAKTDIQGNAFLTNLQEKAF